jgi:hypothetical protein
MKKSSGLSKKSYELFSKIGIEAVESLGFQKLLWYLNPRDMLFMWMFPPKINEQCVYVSYFRRLMPAREKMDLWIFGWLVITNEGRLRFVWSYSVSNKAFDAYIRFEDFSTDWMEPLPNSIYRSMKVDPIYRTRMTHASKNPKSRWSRFVEFILKRS